MFTSFPAPATDKDVQFSVFIFQEKCFHCQRKKGTFTTFIASSINDILFESSSCWAISVLSSTVRQKHGVAFCPNQYHVSIHRSKNSNLGQLPVCGSFCFWHITPYRAIAVKICETNKCFIPFIDSFCLGFRCAFHKKNPRSAMV